MVEELRLSRPTTYLELLHNKKRREQRNLSGGDPELDRCRPNDLGMPLDHTTSPHLGKRIVRGAEYRAPRAYGEGDDGGGDGSDAEGTPAATADSSGDPNGGTAAGSGSALDRYGRLTAGARKPKAPAATVWVCARQVRSGSAPPARLPLRSDRGVAGSITGRAAGPSRQPVSAVRSAGSAASVSDPKGEGASGKGSARSADAGSARRGAGSRRASDASSASGSAASAAEEPSLRPTVAREVADAAAATAALLPRAPAPDAEPRLTATAAGVQTDPVPKPRRPACQQCLVHNQERMKLLHELTRSDREWREMVLLLEGQLDESRSRVTELEGLVRHQQRQLAAAKHREQSGAARARAAEAAAANEPPPPPPPRAPPTAPPPPPTTSRRPDRDGDSAGGGGAAGGGGGAAAGGGGGDAPTSEGGGSLGGRAGGGDVARGGSAATDGGCGNQCSSSGGSGGSGGATRTVGACPESRRLYPPPQQLCAWGTSTDLLPPPPPPPLPPQPQPRVAAPPSEGSGANDRCGAMKAAQDDLKSRLVQCAMGALTRSIDATQPSRVDAALRSPPPSETTGTTAMISSSSSGSAEAARSGGATSTAARSDGFDAKDLIRRAQDALQSEPARLRAPRQLFGGGSDARAGAAAVPVM